MDNTPKTTRKRRPSKENEPRAAQWMYVNAPSKNKQPLTGTILTYAEQDKSEEASSIAVAFRHILMVSSTVTKMEHRIKDKKGGETEVILTDVQRLSKQFEQHVLRNQFQSSCGGSLFS